MSVLVVQMGHVPRTTGATGTSGGGVSEQDYARAVAAACVTVLGGKGGWSVRPINADVADSSYRGDAFVAVHCNGSLNAGVHGASVGWQTSEGRAHGDRWKAAYAARGWTRGFERDNNTVNLAQYYGVREAVGQGNRRAIIIECGYLTNAEDRAAMLGPGITRVALAIGDAFGIPHGMDTQIMAFLDEPISGTNEDNGTRLARRAEAILEMRDKTGGAFAETNQLAAVLKGIAADVADLKAGQAELTTLLTDLVGSGIVLRPAGEITVKADRV